MYTHIATSIFILSDTRCPYEFPTSREKKKKKAKNCRICKKSTFILLPIYL